MIPTIYNYTTINMFAFCLTPETDHHYFNDLEWYFK